MTGPLPRIDRTDHLRRARAALAEIAPGLIVTDPANIRWLTGFTGSAATVALTGDDLVLATDGRYGEQAAGEVDPGSVRVVVARDSRDAIVAAVGGLAAVALEADSVSWSRQRLIASDWLPEVEIVATGRLMLDLRTVKQDSEIARIRRAATITDRALASVLAEGLVGRSEASIAWEIEGRMRELGADRAGYDLIVAGGPNGARPHHRPTRRPVMAGELVVVDVGAEVDGYRSDMTRTYATGAPSRRQRALLDAVTRAQRRGVDAVRPGVEGAAIDRACRDELANEGIGDAFVHGTGHGVGLEIHEPPLLSGSCTSRLCEGQVITVEPGVYFEGEGGVRIEDTILVGPDCAEPLTRAPKEPVLAV